MQLASYIITFKNKVMSNVLETIRTDIKNWWWFLITGIIFIVAGIVIYLRPLEGYLSLSIL